MSGSRRAAREFALKGLYAWQLAQQERGDIALALHDDPQFRKADEEYFHKLFHGVLDAGPALADALRPYLDREVAELSPIERSILMIGAYELVHCPDVPYRVAINEAVELAKQYGGTDGHKYVNGVLDKLAREVRSSEIQALTKQDAR
ncbi:MAG: transcription antitermination factor NusB [Thiobacillaceae bacterium]